MSSDLLAEFDSFYKSQGAQQESSGRENNQATPQNSGSVDQTWADARFQQWPVSQPTVNHDIWGEMRSFEEAPSAQQTAPQDDIWGSFETATPSIATASLPNSSQRLGSEQNIPSSQQLYTDDPKPGLIRRPTLEMFSGSGGYGEQSKGSTIRNPISVKSQKLEPPSSSSQGEVLFDANDELSKGTDEDDDEFGDFEDAQPVQPAPKPISSSLDDLFGDLTMNQPTSNTTSHFSKPPPLADISENEDLPDPKQNARSSVSDLPRSHSSTGGEKSSVANPSGKRPAVDKKPGRIVEPPRRTRITDEDWSNFEAAPSEAPAIESAMAISDDDDDAWNWDGAWAMNTAPQPKDTTAKQRSSKPASISTPAVSSKTANESPPTNIPPPSILLSLFASLFDLPQSSLFKPVANQPTSIKNRIMSDPSTIDFLRGYLLLATVVAHILAGRKLRWKRDTLLSQAMKIGPAAAGGKGGMKLTGVDKAETAREDREAADVVRIWKDQLGRLRSAVAAANSSIKDLRSI